MTSKYTQEQVERAVELVRGKHMSLNGASKAFGIPYATLGDKVRGRRPIKAGPKTVLEEEDENKLACWLKELSKRGFGRSKEDLKDMVKKILDERGAKTIFKDNRPGKDWVRSFFKRHPELSERTTQALGRERALVTREALGGWFHDMKVYLDSKDDRLLNSPERLFNADESGFNICPKTKKVISISGAKHVYSVTSSNRQQVTVLACCSATGQYFPPLLIFPYKRDPAFNALDGFEESLFQKTPNGWITEEVFHSFLRDIFIPNLKCQRPVVLFVDGHTSHHSLAISTLCEESGVILYCLKSHASHLIQPLDQAFFGAIKPAWSEAVRKFQYETGENVTMRTFARTFKKAWDGTARPELAFKGFAKSGIFPYNPDLVLNSDKLKPSASYMNVCVQPDGGQVVACTEKPDDKVNEDSGDKHVNESDDTTTNVVVPAGRNSSMPTVQTEVPSTSKDAQSTTPNAVVPADRNSSMPTFQQAVPSTEDKFSDMVCFAKLNFSLGEEKSTLFYKRYEEKYDVVDGDEEYSKWKCILEKLIGFKVPVPLTIEKVPVPMTTEKVPVSMTTEKVPVSMTTEKNKNIDKLLTMPTFPKRKGVKRPSSSLPSPLSGAEYRQMIEEKEKKKEEEERQKAERKKNREERKIRKIDEAVARKKRIDERKQQREIMKKEKEERKRIKQLKAASKKMKEESDSAESEDEPSFNESDEPMDETDAADIIFEKCRKCKIVTKDEVRVQCVLCDSWWHAGCVSNFDLTEKSQMDIDAMNMDYFCEECSSGFM